MKISIKRNKKIWTLWENFCEIAGTWECLKRLHIELFGGLFDFAGEIRSKNISKNGFRFANAIFIEANIPIIERMPQKNFEEILEKYIEMNILHPFREGNGRTMRLWFDAMLEKELKTRVNWIKISREKYLSAMQRSPVNSLELEILLKNFLIPSDLLNDSVIFMKDLSASYSYEI